MRRIAKWVMAALVVLLSGTACLPAEQEPPPPFQTIVPPDLPQEDQAEPTPLIRTPDASPAGTPTFMLVETPDPAEVATDALAAALGVLPEAISVVDIVPVQWVDTSLGCPEPGRDYVAVVTPGYLVTLNVSEAVYAVHTDLVGTAIVCAETSDPIGPGTVPDPIVAEFIAQAKANLAEFLSIAPEEIALVRSEAVEWSDSSIGCAIAGQDYLQVITVGYRIILAVDDTRYEYHTDQHRMIRCDVPTE